MTIKKITLVGSVLGASIPLVLLSSALFADADESPLPPANQAGAETSASDPGEGSLFRPTLAQLRACDSVIPPDPEAYPVAVMYNREAVIPPQCYTKTELLHNPCYVCHQDAIPGRENVMNDADLQSAYSFSDLGMTNLWKNLFEDRTERVAHISDEEVLAYIRENNYSGLPERLREVDFKGWIPDLKDLHLGAEAFDDEGFAKDGSHWVAFNYKPMPSTFWPTNGSTDDVMIRLAEPLRTDADGNYSRDVYKANLAIVEATIKGATTMSCLPVDERKVGKDLDGDGSLGVALKVADVSTFVGAGKGYWKEDSTYPQGTEFLHTVRYVGVDEKGQIGVSTRMKEVRYMSKKQAYAKPVYARKYQLEGFDKEAGNYPGYAIIGEHGLDNGSGWAISGFIEGRRGLLRRYTHEENFSCMSCHSSIGSTIDHTFSFPRKLEGAAGWGYLNLKGMADAPTMGEKEGEYLTYLERVGGGSEFRNNEEMNERWFKTDGSLDRKKVKEAADIYDLITPSRARALALNKAYWTIVQDQDYIFGKDATLTPPKNVHRKIDNETTRTLPAERVFSWNILLDWEAGRK